MTSRTGLHGFSTLRLPLVWLAALTLCACGPVGPDYHKPAVEMPPAWTPDEPWRLGAPSDGQIKGRWWEMMSDRALNALEERALAGSPSLAIAAARLDQARAQAAVAAAGLYPTVNLNAGAARERISANRPLTDYGKTNSSTVQSEYSAGFTARWEIDVFGRVRRSVENTQALAAQSLADVENARLVLTSEVAGDYFSLRETDSEIDVVRQSIELQRRALEFVTARHDLGAASGLDVAQQKALLDATSTQIDLLRNQRDRYEHAIAALIGAPAPGFSIAPALLSGTPPPPPLGVPSDVLERRPDVASAERAMAAANAQIGVAQAAFYPSFIMAPDYGVDSRMFSTLFNAPSVLWALGVQASQVVFDADRTRANVRFAEAGYQGAVAAYRQTVLTALQEVQDGISGLVTLQRAYNEAAAAVASSQRLLELANERYSGGLATYLDVITAQQSLLTNQRQAAQILGQQLVDSVFLVKALGGGYQAPSMPTSRG
jgi:multidrug efflux system outer membrane protein